MGGGLRGELCTHRGSKHSFRVNQAGMAYDSRAHVLWPWLWSSLLCFVAANFKFVALVEKMPQLF